jgi:hypothetical protein
VRSRGKRVKNEKQREEWELARSREKRGNRQGAENKREKK